MSHAEQPPGNGGGAGTDTRPAAFRGWDFIKAWAPIGILFVAISSLFYAINSGIEARLTRLISEVQSDVKETRKEIHGDVSDARKEISTALSDARREVNAATSQLTAVTAQTSSLFRDLGSHASEIKQIKNQTDKIEALQQGLEYNTGETEKIKGETERIKQDTGGIQEIKKTVSSISDKIQTSKSHEDRYIESFGLKPGSFHSGTFNGRIIAFPLTSGKEAAKELEEKRFTKMRSRLGGTELQAFVPPRRGVNDLPAVLDQSILTISIVARSTQTPSQPSSHPTENPSSPAPDGSR